MARTSIKNKIILSFLLLLLIMVTVVGVVNQIAGDFYLAQAISTSLSLCAGIFFGGIFSRSLVGRLNRLSRAAREISNGDLSREIPVVSEDEIRDLEEVFTTMVNDLRHMISEMKTVSRKIRSTNSDLNRLASKVLENSHEIDRSAQMIAKSSEAQSLIVQKTSVRLESGLRAMDEMARQSSLTMEKLTHARNQTEAGEASARQTLSHLEEVLKEMVTSTKPVMRLANKIEKIKLVINIMNDIAQKTDLLSLNASIEATRAGDAGKGFALVADEIRNMAENSKNSSQEIRKLVEDILEENRSVVEALQTTQGEIRKGREIINQIVKTFVGMLSGVKTVFAEIQEIEAVTRRQVDQLRGLLDQFKELSRLADGNFLATQKTTVATRNQKEDMEEIAAALKVLDGLSGQMMAAQGRFKIGSDHGDPENGISG